MNAQEGESKKEDSLKYIFETRLKLLEEIFDQPEVRIDSAVRLSIWHVVNNVYGERIPPEAHRIGDIEYTLQSLEQIPLSSTEIARSVASTQEIVDIYYRTIVYPYLLKKGIDTDVSQEAIYEQIIDIVWAELGNENIHVLQSRDIAARILLQSQPLATL